MQTFTEQFYVNEKTFALVSQILFPDYQFPDSWKSPRSPTIRKNLNNSKTTNAIITKFPHSMSLCQETCNISSNYDATVIIYRP